MIALFSLLLMILSLASASDVVRFDEKFATCSSTFVSAKVSSIESFSVSSSAGGSVQCAGSNAPTVTAGTLSVDLAYNSVTPTPSTLTHTVDRAVTVPRGTSLTLEFWINTGSDTFGGTVFATHTITGTSNLYGPLLPVGDAINGFRKYRYVFIIPPGNSVNIDVTVNIKVQQAAAYLEHVYLDDISLRYLLPSVNGDPQFAGLYGQSYQVHGIDGPVYNLVSSSTTQVNARFVFLEDGECPIFHGIPARNCFAHAGSYLGSIGVQQVVGAVNHKLAIVSGPATEGFASITLDGKLMSLNETSQDTGVFSVHYVSSHMIKVNTTDFSFTFENSDMFINQAVQPRRPLSQLTSHGLFGQTHKRTLYPTKLKYIEGEVDDYMISEDELFGTSFMFNQFHHDE